MVMVDINSPQGRRLHFTLHLEDCDLNQPMGKHKLRIPGCKADLMEERAWGWIRNTNLSGKVVQRGIPWTWRETMSILALLLELGGVFLPRSSFVY